MTSGSTFAMEIRSLFSVMFSSKMGNSLMTVQVLLEMKQ